MAESMRHVATMMGEVDDQSETEKTYSPLGHAGLFAINFVFSVISVHDHRKNSKLSDCVKEAAIPVVVQMLFALTNDEAVAEYARYRRTGYLGRPSDGDRARIQEFKEFVRKIARRSEEINEYFLRNQYDIPLQTRLYGYDRERGHYWSQPIEMPVIECDEDDY